MANKMSRKGQIAIWVIIALVLAVSIIIYFIVNKFTLTSDAQTFNPRPIIERCISESVNEAVDIMLPQGGFVNPTNVKWWNYTNITIMCYGKDYLEQCTQQHPMLLSEMRDEISNYIKPRIEECFATVEEAGRSKGWSVEFGEMSMNVRLAPDRVLVNVSRETRLTRAEITETFKDYGSEVVNPVYNFGVVAIEISDYEAKACTFNAVSYMKIYPRFTIRNTITSDSTKIYFIRDNNSGKEMRMATRSCAMPYV